MSRADEMQDSRRWELQASGEMEDEGIGESKQGRIPWIEPQVDWSCLRVCYVSRVLCDDGTVSDQASDLGEAVAFWQTQLCSVP